MKTWRENNPIEKPKIYNKNDNFFGLQKECQYCPALDLVPLSCNNHII